jgi:hypothetical protein
MLQKLAFALIGLGGLALIGWVVSGFFTSSEVPLVVRIAVGVIAVGILVLFGVAIRERVAKANNQDFKEVDN